MDVWRRFRLYILCDFIMLGKQNGSLLTVLFARDVIERFLFWLRLCESVVLLAEKRRGRFYLVVLRKVVSWRFRSLSLKLGFSIPPFVFGPGLRIPHYGTIVVNSNARIGSCCVLHTSSCIAGNEKKIIGSGFYLSTGAVVAGMVELGDDVTVGANSFVGRSCPTSNCLLIGSPARAVGGRLGWYRQGESDYINRVRRVRRIDSLFRLSSSV